MIVHTNQVTINKQKQLLIISMNCFVLFLIIVVFRLIATGEFIGKYDNLIYPVCWLLLFTFIWAVISWKWLINRFFDPYILFLFSFLLFNGGQGVLEILHLNTFGILASNDPRSLNANFSSEILITTLLIVILSLTTLHTGALFNIVLNKDKKVIFKKDDVSPKKFLLIHKYVLWIGWVLLGISLVPAFFTLGSAISNVTTYGYLALYQENIPVGAEATPRILATFLIPAALFLLAGSNKKQNIIAISMIVIITISIIQLFLGARSQAVMPMVAYLWLWHRCIKPLPKVLILISSSLVLLIILPLVGSIRLISGEDRLSLDFIIDAFFSIDNPAIAIFSEMGSSMGTIAHTIELVPSQRGFDMGASYGYALLTLIPNLFWDIHPTIARGLAEKWLVDTVNPYISSIGGTMGYSFIAEAYLNFGLIGTAIFMAFFGFLFAKLTLWSVKDNQPAKMATMASFLSFVLFYPRAESALLIRPLVWYSLLPYLLTNVVKLTHKKSVTSKLIGKVYKKY
ncbi:MAG: O-antigen polysaccharide polymerase Wzy family protein [Brasilonema angustatum HA4187-MV1]|jgi:oligosaccharide repeat unit polymerase|nr:O-antigen polysaccharide polymerase Wzy family protein [Brasilonema angustatum HA4187-MV1]